MANPFETGLLAVTAANNPSVAADALSLIGGDTGMAAPFGGASLGQFLGGSGDPTGGLVPQGGGVAGGFGGGQIPGALLQGFGGGGAQVAGAGGAAGANPLAGLQGFKGPEQVKPEFAGGIRGAQQAPQQNFQGANPSIIMQQLQALLQGPQQGAVPPLGNLLGRR